MVDQTIVKDVIALVFSTDVVQAFVSGLDLGNNNSRMDLILVFCTLGGLHQLSLSETSSLKEIKLRITKIVFF